MKQKGFAPVFIILTIVLLTGLGYFAYSYIGSNKPKVMNVPNNTILPLSELNPQSTPLSLPFFSPPTTWKTYIDNKNKFSISYPPNLVYKEDYGYADIKKGENNNLVRKQILSFTITDTFSGLIKNCEDLREQNISGRITYTGGYLSAEGIKKYPIIIGSTEAVAIEAIGEFQEGKRFSKIVYICKNNISYEIYWLDENIGDDRNLLINQILSTFKFTQ